MKKIPRIFLIEDSLADQEIFKRAIYDEDLSWDIKIFDSGTEALQELNNLCDYKNKICELPDLILLDINMPIINGWYVLKELRKNLQLRHIPIIILTTSSRDTDILNAYRLGANAYLTKANDVKGFINLITTIDSFWFKLAKLPNSESQLN